MASAASGSAIASAYDGYITLSPMAEDDSYHCCHKELPFKIVSNLLLRTHYQTVSPFPVFGHKLTDDRLRRFHLGSFSREDHYICEHRYNFLSEVHKLAIASDTETAEHQKIQLNKLSENNCVFSRAHKQ